MSDQGTPARGGVLSDAVRSHIHEGILSGLYKPGDRLREAELAARLGVSRSPIREAISVLEGEGLVVYGPGKGLTIARFSRLETIELFAYREILEGLAAELAAQSITDETVDRLEGLVRAYRAARDEVSLARNNQEFHRVIYHCTGNSYLIESIGTLRTLLALLPVEGTARRRAPTEVAAEHEALLEALRARDPARSRQVAEMHVRNSAAALLKVMLKEEVSGKARGRLAQP